jgi:S-adenosylmethionine:tRNA ribosyltransferase-isomerase
MRTSDFDYELPREQIAQRPSERREGCRMMVLDRAARTREHRTFEDLPQYLRPGDLLVLNDTRVFPARLLGRWEDTPGRVELLLLEPLAGENEWEALMRSGRPFKAGAIAAFRAGVREAAFRAGMREAAFRAGMRDPAEDGGVQNQDGGVQDQGDGVQDPAPLRAEMLRRVEGVSGGVVVRLVFEGELWPLLERCGETPLPPYIRRTPAAMTEEERREDAERYQTVYAERIGAVAAPTAGLHFSKAMLAALEAQGIEIAKITLHVGPGTFRPVTVENPEEHQMHSERYEVPAAAAEAIERCRARGGRIVAVGSTTVRTLETMAQEHGGRAVPCSGRSALFIREPFKFSFTDMMITNFHLPKSTLLMMVAALAGRDFVLESYREAVERGYRFFSYGDCMLIK